jgi:hypothetical protein
MELTPLLVMYAGDSADGVGERHGSSIRAVDRSTTETVAAVEEVSLRVRQRKHIRGLRRRRPGGHERVER